MDEYELKPLKVGVAKYHVVFIPKCREGVYGKLRRHLGEVFRKLGRAEGMPDEEGIFWPTMFNMNDLDPAEVFRVVGDGFIQG